MAKNNSLVPAGGGARKVLGPFFIVLRPPRRDFGLHFASPGGSREVLFGVFSKKNAKTLDFEYLPSGNHGFVGSGGAFVVFFRSKFY